MASTCSVVLVLFVLVGSCLMAAEAQLGLISSLLGLIHIQGTLFCTANGNVNVNGSATPVFPNALVQLKCGSSGNVVASSTTNQSGLFSILLDPLQFLLNSLLTDCNLVVDTPLANCNANLPNVASALTSALKFFGNLIFGPLQITNLVPIGFQSTIST